MDLDLLLLLPEKRRVGYGCEDPQEKEAAARENLSRRGALSLFSFNSIKRTGQYKAGQLPGYLLTRAGAGPLTVVSLYGELDPIEAFATRPTWSPSQRPPTSSVTSSGGSGPTAETTSPTQPLSTPEESSLVKELRQESCHIPLDFL